MPLTVFDHVNLACFESKLDSFGKHQLGGDPHGLGVAFSRISNVVHLVAVLNADDPCNSIVPSGLSFLPLCYGFRFASNGGEFQYLVEHDGHVEILPDPLYSRLNLFEKIRWRISRFQLRITGTIEYDHTHQYRPDFPYCGHPDVFDEHKIRFERKKYDPTNAEDALELQGVFGLSHLSSQEMGRAIEIALTNSSYVSDPEDYDEFGWTDQEKVEILGRSPFYQAAPSKSCYNTKCTSGRHEDTVKVIAIHEPDDDVIWGGAYVQLIYTLCERCRCITVSNQCT